MNGLHGFSAINTLPLLRRAISSRTTLNVSPGTGTTAEDDVKTPLTEYNISKFAYETLVPESLEDVRERVKSIAHMFQELMENQSFTPTRLS